MSDLQRPTPTGDRVTMYRGDFKEALENGLIKAQDLTEWGIPKWQAYHVNRPTISNEPIGYGRTREAAIHDLKLRWPNPPPHTAER